MGERLVIAWSELLLNSNGYGACSYHGRVKVGQYEYRFDCIECFSNNRPTTQVTLSLFSCVLSVEQVVGSINRVQAHCENMLRTHLRQVVGALGQLGITADEESLCLKWRWSADRREASARYRGYLLSVVNGASAATWVITQKGAVLDCGAVMTHMETALEDAVAALQRVLKETALGVSAAGMKGDTRV